MIQAVHATRELSLYPSHLLSLMLSKLSCKLKLGEKEGGRKEDKLVKWKEAESQCLKGQRQGKSFTNHGQRRRRTNSKGGFARAVSDLDFSLFFFYYFMVWFLLKYMVNVFLSNRKCYN